jgi:hypothetical protein
MREAISSMPFSNPAYPQYSIEPLRTFSYAGLAFPIFIVVMLLYYRSRFLEPARAKAFDYSVLTNCMQPGRLRTRLVQ